MILSQIAFRFLRQWWFGVRERLWRCAKPTELFGGQANPADLPAIICLGAMRAASIAKKFIVKGVSVRVHDLTVANQSGQLVADQCRKVEHPMVGFGAGT